MWLHPYCSRTIGDVEEIGEWLTEPVSFLAVRMPLTLSSHARSITSTSAWIQQQPWNLKSVITEPINSQTSMQFMFMVEYLRKGYVILSSDMPYFFNQTPRLPRCSFLCGYSLRAATLWGRLFEGGVYFFRKPAGIKDGYVRAIQWRPLNAVSSRRSLTVLLSALERDCKHEQVALVRWLSS